MGKDWLYWLSGGYGGAGKSGPRSKKQRAATSAGCMCSVSQLLGLHRFQIPLNSDYSDGIFVHDEEEEEANVTNKFKGLEAPRNSLELEEPMKKEEVHLNFPVGIIPIKTSHEKISSPRISTTSTSKSRIDDFSSDSPCTKTPTLVARLMGLDLLPDSTTSSPSFSSSSNSKNSNLAQNYKRKDNKILPKRSFFDDDITIGARSERRRSDVEYYHDHRLSLQVNKENVGEEFGISGRFGGKSAIKGRFDHGSRSPSHYAKQIVKQVKESVGKRMGLSDITNTNEYNRRDENLVLLKPTKKIITNKSKDVGEITTTQSCSPRLRFLDTNKNKSVVVTNSDSTTHSPRIVSVQCVDESLSKIVTLQEQPCDHGIKKKKGEERFVGSKATNYKAKLVEKKSKNKNHHWSSSEILNISGPMLLLPVKKDPSPPATKLPQKQVQPSDALQSKSSNSRQLPSNSHHSYKHPHNKKILITTTTTTVQKKPVTTSHGGDAAAYKSFIQKILKRADINTTQLNPSTWHPLDPSIFHYIEVFHHAGGGGGVLSRRCNRKLIFELIDEILCGLVSKSDFSKWGRVRIHEFTLVDEVCRKISSFPAKNCEVLEDIDGLIDTDLCTYSRIDEEREGLVCEIEKEIMDMLVRETAATVAVMASVRRRTVGKRLTSGTW